MLDEKQVRHVAKLARIELGDQEVQKFAGQLSKVFGYVEILNEADTDDVTETSQVTGLQNVMEEDEIMPSQTTPEKLLGSSELPIDSNQIRVKRVV